MSFTPEQVEQLLHPINPRRVLKDGKGHAHVSQQDVTAHLIRVLGFGNFDTDLMDASMIFESERIDKPGRFDVCYRATMRLTCRDPEGREVCHFENGSTATAQNQTRGDAHDLAFKSAISLSIKRAAIALGDQFGLSLYNKGQMTALVMGKLVGRDKAPAKRDMQDGVPQQVSLGNDEIEADAQPVEAPAQKAPPATRTMSRITGRQAKAPDDGWIPPQTDDAAAPTLPSEGVTPPAAAASPDVIDPKGKQMKAIHAGMNEAGLGERVAGFQFLSEVTGRNVTTSKDLTRAEAGKVLDELAEINQHPFGDEPPMSGDRDE